MTRSQPRTVADLPEGQRAQVGVAVHEAGHACVAVLHYAAIDRVAVLRGGPRTGALTAAGVCRYGVGEFDSLVQVRRPAIVAAGTVAQAVWHYGARPTSRQIDALLEVNTADRDELITHACAQGEPVRAQEVLPTVQHLWPSIAALAARLHRHGQARHADVLAALGIASAADAPSTLNAIRNGHRPVPILSDTQPPAPRH